MSNIFQDLMILPKTMDDVWVLGVVTSLSPLRVRIATESLPLAGVPQNLAGTLIVGQKVMLHIYDRDIYIHGPSVDPDRITSLETFRTDTNGVLLDIAQQRPYNTTNLLSDPRGLGGSGGLIGWANEGGAWYLTPTGGGQGKAFVSPMNTTWVTLRNRRVITVNPGETYRASAWIYHTTAGAGGYVGIQVNFFDDTSTYINFAGSPSVATTVGVWTKVEFQFTTPDNSAYMHFYATANNRTLNSSHLFYFNRPSVVQLIEPYDTGWITPLPGYANTWGGHVNYPPAYRKRDGQVMLKGLIHRASGSSTMEETMFALPASYRPAQSLHVATTQNNAFASIGINTNGAVVWKAGTAAASWLSLDTISFPAEQ